MKHPFLPAVLALSLGLAFAGDNPVTVVPGPIGGHIHPSICQAADGTLVVVCKGGGGLICARSGDGGATWDTPKLIPTTPKRPDSIREVKIFEVYPGTLDALPDGRLLTTWNYIADDKAADGYYERALLYSLSADTGQTWGEQLLIGPIDGKHLGAVRHNVLVWPDGRWLLPLRTGPSRLYDPKTGKLEVFPVVGPDGAGDEFQQITRTADGALLAMGPVLLRSTNEGKIWTAIENFPASASARDNQEGRFLTALGDGGVIVTWGVGGDNKGLRFNFSADNGQTWNQEMLTLLPETAISARYYSARTIQLDETHAGVVFMNGQGVHFLRVGLDRLRNPAGANNN